MFMRQIIWIGIIAVILLGSCKGNKAQNQEAPQNDSTATGTVQAFKLPEIPVMLTAPEARAKFLVEHYWDNYNFADTNYIHHPEIAEQALADYLNIMNHVPLEVAQSATTDFMRRAEQNKKVYLYFTDLADRYLYDPNSPYRNEEIYIPVLEAMKSSSILDDTEKIRPASRLKLAYKNRMGTKAANFKYTMNSGKQGSLYNIKTDYTIVYFNNPGCHACREITEGMKRSVQIDRLMQNKKLTILAMYPDEDLEEWRIHQTDFPADWINGYDKKQVLNGEQLYDLKAIPTLYLLDKNKTVLLKDTTLDMIENYFYNNLK